MCETHRHAAVRRRLSGAEVTHGPGHVISGHGGRPGESIGEPALRVQAGRLDGHVGDGPVGGVVPQCHAEGGFEGGLVETRESFPRMSRRELSHGRVPARRQRRRRKDDERTREENER